MKPYVISHMNTSIDGRTWGSRWRPVENRMAGLFERIHEQLGNGSWLIGRVTGSEYAKEDTYPDHPGEVFPREPWFVRRDAAAYGITRASEQRSRWAREDLLLDGELASYEQTLVEAWQPRHAAALDELTPSCPPNKKIALGQAVFKWVEQDASFPLRSVRERFL
jgi:hypothetical protein